MMLRNPFETDGIWLKANLHTHTTRSDGDTDPADRVAQYADAGYDVLAITDHRQVTPIKPLQRDDILLLQSLEAHPACPDGPMYHLVCLNVSAEFEYDEAMPANRIIDAVRSGGGEVIAGHPYWCGHTVEQVLALEGIIGIEVYNATCSKIGKADSSTVWDYLLATGRCMPAVAVDDVHRGRDIFMGWTMIRAADRSVAAVMEALRQGCYYASSGPAIHDVRFGPDGLTVRCDPVQEIHFICRGARGRSLYAEEGGELLRHAAYEPAGGSQYVRIQIVDDQGRRAWSNPFVL